LLLGRGPDSGKGNSLKLCCSRFLEFIPEKTRVQTKGICCEIMRRPRGEKL